MPGRAGGWGARQRETLDWVHLMDLWFSVAQTKSLRGLFRNVSNLGNMVEQVRNCRTVLIWMSHFWCPCQRVGFITCSQFQAHSSCSS